jgi:hypothetical protein
VNTTRRYPRSLSEAFPDERYYAIFDACGRGRAFVTPYRASQLREFIDIYRLYRRASHSRWYCVKMAWGIVVIGRDF